MNDSLAGTTGYTDVDGSRFGLPPSRETIAQERETYVNLADEASALDFDRDDFDPIALNLADAYARRYGVPRFDELSGGIDAALLVVAEIEGREEAFR